MYIPVRLRTVCIR